MDRNTGTDIATYATTNSFFSPFESLSSRIPLSLLLLCSGLFPQHSPPPTLLNLQSCSWLHLEVLFWLVGWLVGWSPKALG